MTPATARRARVRRRVTQNGPTGGGILSANNLTSRPRGPGRRGFQLERLLLVREKSERNRTMRKMSESEMRAVDGGRLLWYKRAAIGYIYCWTNGRKTWTEWSLWPPCGPARLIR